MKSPSISSRRAWNLLLTGAACLVLFAQSVYSQFAGYYSENNENLPAWESGAISTSPFGTGYVLGADSQVELEPPATYPVSSLARFDDSSTLLWSVFMDTGPGTIDHELIADFADTSKFFAGFVEEGVSVKVGLFNGSDLSPVFAHQIPMQALTPDKVQLSYFPGKLSGIFQNLGASLRFLVLDGTGTPVFEKTYTSANFLETETPFLSTQTAEVSQIPDESGFYISVHRADLDFITLSTNNKYFLINVDNSGTPRWAKSFEIVALTSLADTSGPGPDNSYFYRLSDVDATTGVPTAHLIKLSSSGSLDFAESIEGFRISSGFPIETETSMHFSGTLSVPGSLTMSHFAAIKINAGSGAIEAQMGLDQAAGEFGFIAGEADGKLYGTLLYSDDPDFEETTTMVMRMDADLTNPIGYDYSGVGIAGFLAIKNDNAMVFSEYDMASGIVGAFTLNADLIPALTGCESFTPATMNPINPQLTVAPLSLSLSNLAVNAGAVSSTLSATTLPLEVLALNEESCSTGGGEVNISDQPQTQSIAAGETVSFSVTATGTEPISYQWRKDGADIGGATTRIFEIPAAQPGDEGDYTVVITDGNGIMTVSNAATLTVNLLAPLAITEQPISQIVTLGGSATLSVKATAGSGIITYQWFKNNVEIANATFDTLMLSNITESDLGNYVVVVTNGSNSLNSTPAQLSLEIAENAGFVAYLALLSVPENMRGFMDDPDKDKVPSGIEYLMGFDAGDPASSPQITPSIISLAGQQYFAISFPRNMSVSDLSLTTQFSSSINFETFSTGIDVSVEPLGNGMEWVTQRSSTPVGDESMFARISGGDG